MVAHIPGRKGVGGWVAVLALAVLPLAGCNTLWDDITSREFFNDTFSPAPDPLVVLRDSRDGDKRHRALQRLGDVDPGSLSPEEAEATLNVLVGAAGTERQVWARIAAVRALGNWNDPRAAEGLKDAYYRASAFPGDGGVALKAQALAALGRCGHPSAVDTLVKVLRQPPAEGSPTEQQQQLQERLTAARALGRYDNPAGKLALLEVLQKEQDPGLRNRAHESLVRLSGRDLPPDAVVWEQFLRDPASAPPKTLGERFREVVPVSWGTDW